MYFQMMRKTWHSDYVLLTCVYVR